MRTKELAWGALCVDVGFANAGWAVLLAGKVHAAGVISTEPVKGVTKIRVADSDVERCRYIYRQLLAAATDPAYNIKVLFVELPMSGGKSARAVSAMARAQAIAACLAEQLKLPVEWVTPTAVKKSTYGTNSASKEQVTEFVLARYPELRKFLPRATTKHEHITDAVGAFIAAEFGQLGSMLRANWEACR